MPNDDVEQDGLRSLLADGAVLERVSTGCTWNEGPVWLADLGVVRWSDIPGDRIMQFDPSTGSTEIHRAGVEFTNGRALDPIGGGVVQCSHGRRAVEREIDGTVEVLVDCWNGARLNSPNDVVVRSDGTIWFTDPAYGITIDGEGHPGTREYADHFVFRYDPATRDLRVVIADVEEPNGLAFSPDEQILYVSDTSGARRSDGTGNHHIRAYDVQGDSRAKNGRTFVVIERGLSDGFRVDAAGRIWTSSLDAVVVHDADGTKLGEIAVPEVIANLCFGGPDGHDLYIAASTSMYRITTTTTGAHLGATGSGTDGASEARA